MARLAILSDYEGVTKHIVVSIKNSIMLALAENCLPSNSKNQMNGMKKIYICAWAGESKAVENSIGSAVDICTVSA